MSHLINNELIWVSIPKCASYSIEQSLRNSKLNLEIFVPNDKTRHFHVPVNQCLERWGDKETVCITRDWLSRWLSALNFVWDNIEFESEYTAVRKWEDVDNEYIYKTFNTDFLNKLHLLSNDHDGFRKCWFKLVKENFECELPIRGAVDTLLSQRFFKSNKKCTYEFDISEIDKFTDFIKDRFGERLIINHTNKTSKRPNKIIVNDELKSFIWENFEKRFEKGNHLI